MVDESQIRQEEVTNYICPTCERRYLDKADAEKCFSKRKITSEEKDLLFPVGFTFVLDSRSNTLDETTSSICVTSFSYLLDERHSGGGFECMLNYYLHQNSNFKPTPHEGPWYVENCDVWSSKKIKKGFDKGTFFLLDDDQLEDFKENTLRLVEDIGTKDLVRTFSGLEKFLAKEEGVESQK